MLRGDVVKDDPGNYAVFIEPGASVSPLTAAKVLDVISRLPGCSGQANDAQAHTQVKMKGTPELLHLSEGGLSQDVDQIFESKKTTNLYRWSAIFTVIRWLDSCGRDILRKLLLEGGWERVPGWECLVDDKKMSGTSENMLKMWATLQNKVELEDSASPYLGCTQQASQVNNRIVMDKQELFSKLIGTSTDVTSDGKNPKDITAWSSYNCNVQMQVRQF